MNFRQAVMHDLPGLKSVFGKIVHKLNEENGQIWDDIYPCEFFEGDIENHRLYVLENNGVIVSAFALWGSDAGETHIKWEDDGAKALYFGRFGVNVDYLRGGIGSMMLHRAIELAGNEGVEYLRLFVADNNVPAIKFYIKNGLKKAAGSYVEEFDDGTYLQESAFEIKISNQIINYI